MLGGGPRLLGHQRAQPTFGSTALRRHDDLEVTRTLDDREPDSEGGEERALADGRRRTSGVKDHP